MQMVFCGAKDNEKPVLRLGAAASRLICAMACEQVQLAQ
jgi:hypothetical protein